MKSLGVIGYIVIALILGFIALVFFAIFSLGTPDQIDKTNYLLPGAIALVALLALVRAIFILLEKKEK